MLDLLLDYIIACCSLHSFLVPILVMGIFALVVRISTARY